MEEIEKQPPDAKPRKTVRPGFKYIGALNAVRDKARVGHHIDYKAIAQKFEVNWKVLKQYNYQFLRGEIDLGPNRNESTDILRIRMEVQLEETLHWTKRAHAVDLHCFKFAVKKAEELIQLGKHLEVEKVGVEKIQRRLKGHLEMIAYCERGHSALLEEMLETRRLQQKRMDPDEKEVEAKLVETQVVKLTEEQIALAAVEHLPDV